MTVPFSLPAASDKSVETVVRTDSTLQLSAGLLARVDIVSVGMDGVICYRGDGAGCKGSERSLWSWSERG